MANHKSALKRARQNEMRRIRNRATKTRVKNAVKQVQAAIEPNSDQNAQDLLKEAKSIIDKAAKKGVIHKNTAARKISRLSRMVNTQIS
ncbi:MAG: 30S ribosomal protein S20 [Desulfobacterales bacterium]|nr:30S ribosomal protein S20 [Desulfobacterales bacterium]